MSNEDQLDRLLARGAISAPERERMLQRALPPRQLPVLAWAPRISAAAGMVFALLWLGRSFLGGDDFTARLMAPKLGTLPVMACTMPR